MISWQSAFSTNKQSVFVGSGVSQVHEINFIPERSQFRKVSKWLLNPQITERWRRLVTPPSTTGRRMPADWCPSRWSQALPFLRSSDLADLCALPPSHLWPGRKVAPPSPFFWSCWTWAELLWWFLHWFWCRDWPCSHLMLVSDHRPDGCRVCGVNPEWVCCVWEEHFQNQSILLQHGGLTQFQGACHYLLFPRRRCQLDSDSLCGGRGGTTQYAPEAWNSICSGKLSTVQQQLWFRAQHNTDVWVLISFVLVIWKENIYTSPWNSMFSILLTALLLKNSALLDLFNVQMGGAGQSKPVTYSLISCLSFEGVTMFIFLNTFGEPVATRCNRQPMRNILRGSKVHPVQSFIFLIWIPAEQSYSIPTPETLSSSRTQHI